MSKYPAVLGVVRKAVQSGKFTDQQITDAMLRLASEGRSVTVETLRVELTGHAPPANGRRPSTTDQRIADAQALKSTPGEPPFPFRALPGGTE